MKLLLPWVLVKLLLRLPFSLLVGAFPWINLFSSGVLNNMFLILKAQERKNSF